MNVARQRLRRFGRATGARTSSATSDCIARTVSFGPAPLGPGAYKVTYFNAVYDYCKRMGADWARVHQGMLLSGYINDTHTFVPGPDGKFGYGGKCFPKDVNAFTILTQGTPLGSLLTPLHTLNVHFRGVEEKI